MKLLSDKLKGAHDQLTSEGARLELRQDVLTAVAPAYCALLLVDRLAALPGFRLDPAAMDIAVRGVKAGQGFNLFAGGDSADGVDAIGSVAHGHSKAGRVSDGSEPLQPHTVAQLAMLQRPQRDGRVHTTTTVPAQTLVQPPPPAEPPQSAAMEVPIDFVRLFFGDV